MSRLVKSIGAGVGLAREAIIAHKSSKAEAAAEAAAASSATSSGHDTNRQHADPHAASSTSAATAADDKYEEDDDDEDSGYEDSGDDEADWALDDAQLELAPRPAPPAYTGSPEAEIQQLADAVATQHRGGRGETARSRLPVPVILPQRRPEKSARGFIRAYAPLLADCGIDQATFMDFLDAFDKAIQLHPFFNVVRVVTFAAGMVPDAMVMAINTAVTITNEIAIRISVNKQTNSFLDQMNDKLFKPRGLYAVIIKFRHGDATTATTVEAEDISQVVSKAAAPASKGKAALNSIRPAHGKTYGDVVDAAPLVFPALDAVPDGKKEGVFKRAGKFVGEYYDKRAQAQWAHDNPGSSALNVAPSPQFASRYSDPNHAANSGSLISLVTGGHIDTVGRRQARRKRAREWRGRPSRREQRAEQRKQGKGPPIQRFIRRALRGDVTYLLIGNLPTPEEVAMARTEMQAEAAE